MEEAGGKRWKGPDPSVSSDQQAIQPSEASARSELSRRWRKSRSPIPDHEPGRVLASPCAFGIKPADRRLRADIWPQAAGLKLSEAVGIPGRRAPLRPGASRAAGIGGWCA